ncbi:helix-turn-helix transcriptional regulator [Zhihengliuella halotolerans]|uniref:Regulatory LuxR family protein n=1 Tax=Zhihengliuella halotolerans TaxID=370736 RepID=A0A4V2G9L5_9MICC|nr:LuxR family transcriptional regulator [Zhihengliuella halotolerans]RZU60836.1 regulatory LuxR family protein [Zhihengliuella halotolerans]
MSELPARPELPVWPRLAERLLSSCLIGVRGPSGIGRRDVAAAWAAQRSRETGGPVVTLGPAEFFGDPAEASDALRRAIAAARAAQAGVSIAVVLSPHPAVGDVIRELGGVVSGPRDLLLTRDEARETTRRAYPAGAEMEFEAWFSAAWPVVGGWLRGYDILLARGGDPAESAKHLQSAVDDAWLPWISAQPAADVLTRIGQFPLATEEALAQTESGTLVLGLDAARRAGIVQGDRVPQAVRRACSSALYQRDPNAARAAVRETARALFGAGEYAEGVRTALDAGEWETLVPLLLAGWARLLNDDQALLIRAFRSVPRHVARGYPVVRAGQVLLDPHELNTALPVTSEPDESEIIAELRAEHRSSRSRQRPLALTTATGLMIYERRLGLYDDAYATATDTLRISSVASNDVGPSVHAIAGFEIGLTSLLADDIPQSFAGYELSQSRARRVPHWDALKVSSGGLAVLHALRGDLRAATEWIERGREVVAAHGRHTRAEGALTVAAALTAIEQFDLDGARRELAALPEFPDNSDKWPLHLLALGRLALLEGRTGDIDHMLERAVVDRSVAAGSPIAVRLTAVLRAETELTRQRPREALRIAETRLGDTVDGLVYRAWATISLGGIADGRGLARRALALDPPPRERKIAGGLLAATGKEEDDDVAAFVADYPAPPHSLIGLAPLWQVPERREEVRQLGILPRIDLDRLDSVGFRPFPGLDERPRLTPRERDILDCLKRGLTRKETAEKLFVSDNTVKSQTSSLYAKLGVSSRSEAMAAANRWGL